MSEVAIDLSYIRRLEFRLESVENKIQRGPPPKRTPIGVGGVAETDLETGIVADTGHTAAVWEEGEGVGILEKLRNGKLIPGKVMVWKRSGETVDRSVDPVEWSHEYTDIPKEGRTVKAVNEEVVWLQCEVPDTYVKKADVSN